MRKNEGEKRSEGETVHKGGRQVLSSHLFCHGKEMMEEDGEGEKSEREKKERENKRRKIGRERRKKCKVMSDSPSSCRSFLVVCNRLKMKERHDQKKDTKHGLDID